MSEEKKIKALDLNQLSFQANGKTYYIEGAITIERYAQYMIYEKELAFPTNLKGVFDKLNTLYDMLNKQKFADCAVLVDNLRTGIVKVEEKEPVAAKICALFINYEGEDRSHFSEDMVVKKIADWNAEGIDFKSFFLLASNFVTGYTEIYNSVSRIISERKSL